MIEPAPAARNGRYLDTETTARMFRQTPATEIHYTPQQISALWGLDETTIRDMFRDEPGVLRYAAGEKRSRETIRVPVSVVERVHRKLSE